MQAFFLNASLKQTFFVLALERAHVFLFGPFCIEAETKISEHKKVYNVTKYLANLVSRYLKDLLEAMKTIKT
jgi:hypothetical protein